VQQALDRLQIAISTEEPGRLYLPVECRCRTRLDYSYLAAHVNRCFLMVRTPSCDNALPAKPSTYVTVPSPSGVRVKRSRSHLPSY
jgi:hypothetical protein